VAERKRGMAAGWRRSSRRPGARGRRRVAGAPGRGDRPEPDQPRRRFDEDGLAALAESLKERGVLQPVLVRPRDGGGYELIAGERRWRAARIAGLDTVPAIVRPGDDAASLELALIENMARETSTPSRRRAPARR